MPKAQDSRTPKVVGAGFGRTGTSSLKRALEELGYGPCHHMEEVVKDPSEVPTWERAALGEDIDWADFLQGWGSTVDFPAALYWRELLTTFPDAKVVLTHRDVEGWYESMRTTIVPLLTRFPNRLVGPRLPYISGPFRSMGRSPLKAKLLDRFSDKAHAIRVFEDHLEEVKRTVPSDRLLVYQVKEGWEPLCRFLGVAVPNTPFPRVNDATTFRRRTMAVTALCWIVLLAPLALAASLVAWAL